MELLKMGMVYDENNALYKHMTKIRTTECIVKDNTSVLDPIFIIKTPSGLTVSNVKYNYNYVEFGDRYYFVRDVVLGTGGRIELHCHEDVLMSNSAEIVLLKAIIDKQETAQLSSRYVDDNSYVLRCDKQLQSFNFPVSFNKTSNILITAGGD